MADARDVGAEMPPLGAAAGGRAPCGLKAAVRVLRPFKAESTAPLRALLTPLIL